MLSPGTFGHGGAFGTQGWVDPRREMIFVLLIQRTGFGNGDASKIREVFQELAVRGVKECAGPAMKGLGKGPLLCIIRHPHTGLIVIHAIE